MFFIICSWSLEVGKEAYVKVYDRGTGFSFSPSPSLFYYLLLPHIETYSREQDAYETPLHTSPTLHLLNSPAR